MQKRAEQMDETRQRIVESTVRLHGTLGPAQTTIAGIARDAGVTRLTVYRHFPDFDGLFGGLSGALAGGRTRRRRARVPGRAVDGPGGAGAPRLHRAVRLVSGEGRGRLHLP